MTATEQMIEQLRDAEEVLAVCADHQTHGSELANAYRRAYRDILEARNYTAHEWNLTPRSTEHAIYRCSEAQSPYHSQGADGPCDVWSSAWPTSEVCGQHVARYEKQQAERGRSL